MSLHWSPQHNGEEQDQRLARARTTEQEQIPNRSPDQLQRRPKLSAAAVGDLFGKLLS